MGGDRSDIVWFESRPPFLIFFSRSKTLRNMQCMLLFLLLLTTAPRVNMSSITSVLSLETSVSPQQSCGGDGNRPPRVLRWNARPWQERSLRMSLGEASTPADSLLCKLGLVDGLSDHIIGGWGSLLTLCINGTEYLHQAMITHIIRCKINLRLFTTRLEQRNDVPL
jgi:hypothetical protein